MRASLLSRRQKLGTNRSFDPGAIAGIQWWFKADALALADAAAVDSWTDSSGLGRHAVQASGPLQPVYRTNIVNGQPAIEFGGTQYLRTPAITLVAQPTTMFLVGRNPSGGNTVFVDGIVSGSRNMFYKNTTPMTAFAGANLNGPAASTAWKIRHALFNSTSSKIRVDGGVGTSGNSGTHGITGLTLGASYLSGTNLVGYIAEVIHYSGNLSTDDINKVGFHLAQKYNVPWTTAT